MNSAVRCIFKICPNHWNLINARQHTRNFALCGLRLAFFLSQRKNSCRRIRRQIKWSSPKWMLPGLLTAFILPNRRLGRSLLACFHVVRRWNIRALDVQIKRERRLVMSYRPLRYGFWNRLLWINCCLGSSGISKSPEAFDKNAFY